MRIFSFRKIRRLFSFASMGISRSSGRGVRRRNAFKQRRDAFSAWRLNSEQLEPKKMLAVGAPLQPTFTGGEDGDGFINADEVNNNLVVQVGLNGQAVDTDTLTLETNGGNPVATIGITQAIVGTGFVNFTLAPGVLGADNAAKTLRGVLTTTGGGASFNGPNRTFNLDTTAPTAPRVDSIFGNLATPMPILTGDFGTGTPALGGNSFSVSVAGARYDGEVGTPGDFTFGAGNTTWSLDLDNATPETGTALTPVTLGDLDDDTYPVSATVTDPAGNPSTTTNATGLIVDTVAPEANVLTGPIDGSSFVDGSTIKLFCSRR